jgi:hypothetical protein
VEEKEDNSENGYERASFSVYKMDKGLPNIEKTRELSMA